MKELLVVLTGSRLHGLAHENSDYDYKKIVVSPLSQLLSPWTKQDNSQVKTGDDDVVTYELQHFMRMMGGCNPTILEMLFADRYGFGDEIGAETFGEELMYHRGSLLNAEKVYQAHRGFASDQRKLFTTTKDSKRRGKASVAYIRIMHQGISLLREGAFSPRITDENLKKELMFLKYECEFTEKDNARIVEKICELEEKLTLAYEQSVLKNRKADIAWAEDFLTRAYVELGV